jgi:hypothetical protein
MRASAESRSLSHEKACATRVKGTIAAIDAVCGKHGISAGSKAANRGAQREASEAKGLALETRRAM